jgi:hypothetical protein
MRTCTYARAPRGECINLLRAFVTHLDCRSHADGWVDSLKIAVHVRSRLVFGRGSLDEGSAVSIGEASSGEGRSRDDDDVTAAAAPVVITSDVGLGRVSLSAPSPLLSP